MSGAFDELHAIHVDPCEQFPCGPCVTQDLLVAGIVISDSWDDHCLY